MKITVQVILRGNQYTIEATEVKEIKKAIRDLEEPIATIERLPDGRQDS